MVLMNNKKEELNRLLLEVFVAVRYLRAKKKQGMLSLVSAISIMGVALGVMALIIVLAVMSGFESDLKAKILGTNSHIVILKRGNPSISGVDKLIKTISGIKGVKAASPFIYNQVMLSSGRSVSGVVVRGIDPNYEVDVTSLKKNMTEGSIKGLVMPKEDKKVPSVKNGIIIGIELARNLGVFMNSTVTLISPTGKMGPMGMVPKMKKMRVVGIFNAGMYEYDSGLAYISMGFAQKFFRMGKNVTGIEVKVKSINEAKEVGTAIKAKLGFSYWVRDWMEMNRNLFSALKLEKLAMSIILVLIILVAAFNIVGTLIMVVTEKNKDIAILKTMGAKQESIMRIFMLQGLIIGGLGTLIGGVLGTGICFICDHFQLISLQADVYYISHLPFQMRAFDVIAVCSVSLIISFIATIYPSKYASRLDPVVSLRYE